jgi:polynucleotide kinase-phosphatase
MQLNLPELALVLLIGPSGAGKSTFAHRHFRPTEVLSSDACRAIISDDENDQSVTPEAFRLLYYIVEQRLKLGRLTVIDATHVQRDWRKGALTLAKTYHIPVVAIILDLPEEVCLAQNRLRAHRVLDDAVVRQHHQQLQQSLAGVDQEGFYRIFRLQSPEAVAAAVIHRERARSNRKAETGPFDIIGDVHGCFEELEELLMLLGYRIDRVPDDGKNFGFEVTPPPGPAGLPARKLIFVGDLVDRGPDSPSVLRLAMSMVNARKAYCVPGNHDDKLARYLSGRNVQLKHGLDETVRQLGTESEAFKNTVREFISGLSAHLVFDQGRLVVAHAGLREEMHNRSSGVIHSFCLYGQTTGETDEFGLPVRYNWAAEYQGKAKVVYGHTPVPEAVWINNTIDIDTGCVFGGKLTALRYPEGELVQVPARRQYCPPSRPMEANHITGTGSQAT